MSVEECYSEFVLENPSSVGNSFDDLGVILLCDAKRKLSIISLWKANFGSKLAIFSKVKAFKRLLIIWGFSVRLGVSVKI